MTFKKKATPEVLPELEDDDRLPVAQPIEETMEVIWVRGVVEVPHPTEKKFTRVDEQGVAQYRPRWVTHKPGCRVTLPISEALRFIKMGSARREGQLASVGIHPDLLPGQREDGDVVENRAGIFELADDGVTVIGPARRGG